jgi:HEAT repeat protein
MKKPWRIAGAVLAATLIMATIVVAVSGPREPEYEGRKLTRWLEDLHGPSPSWEQRETNTLIALQQMAPHAVPYLRKMLLAKDSALKKKCSELLSRQRLVNFDLGDAHLRRSDALRGLRLLGADGKAAIPEVAILLDDPALGREAAYTLHRIGPEAVPVLQQALQRTNSRARGDAAGLLGLSREQGSIPDLIKALKDRDFITRSKAARALSRFPEHPEAIVPALIGCLEDPDDTFRMNCARALAAFGTNAGPAFPALLRMVASTNYQEGTTAVAVMMKIDSEGALTDLIKNLTVEDIEVRRRTAWALMAAKKKGKPAVPALVECLKYPDGKLKQNAAVALREIAQEPDMVVPALMDNLNDPDLKVRSVTAIALGSFGEQAKPAVPMLLKLLQQNRDDELTAGGIYDALAKIDPEAAAKLTAK